MSSWIIGIEDNIKKKRKQTNKQKKVVLEDGITEKKQGIPSIFEPWNKGIYNKKKLLHIERNNKG